MKRLRINCKLALLAGQLLFPLTVIAVPPLYPVPSRETPPAITAETVFASHRVRMLSHVPLSAFDRGGGANDVWGYVSPNGREYAILGLERGTGFIDITNPQNPVVIETIDDALSIWSDMAVYDRYAYNVNEAGGGLQVISMIQIDDQFLNIEATVTQLGLWTAHNVYVNPDSAFAYVVGSNLAGGGIVAADLGDPALPVIVGSWSGHYVHDIQVVSYTEGPLAGREIAFAFAAEAGLIIVDVTDKSNMFQVSRLPYPTLIYCHQGWLSKDRRLLYLGDEGDELQHPAVNRTTTYVFNVEDLANPFLLRTFSNGLSAIDHNLMVRGDYVYEANYTTGLRIFHAGNVATIQEVGFFDTYPASNFGTFDGAWGVYTGLPSGVILISDQAGGLFVLLADCNGNDQDDGEELRSGAGKDCDLNGILDACDIAEGTAEDCNGNGVLDACDESDDFTASSGELSPIGSDDPQRFTLASPPFAALDVTLSFTALGDLDGRAAESIDVDLNGVQLGSIYTDLLARCPVDPYEEQMIIPAATFNDIVGDGDAIIDMRPTTRVNSTTCLYDHTFIIVEVSYTPFGATLDCNLTSRPDECEFGDFDGNFIVNSLDFAAYTACLTPPCLHAPCSPPMYSDACCGLADSDRDGDTDLQDFAVLQRSISGS